MTVQELIQLLEREDPEAEVRLMTQESWPFENSIRSRLYVAEPTCSICGEGSLDHDDEDHQAETWTPADAEAPDGVVYLVEGAQLGYGNKAAWQ